jgi:hypothetical protein
MFKYSDLLIFSFLNDQKIVTTCSLQIIPLLFTPPSPLNPPLFTFPSLLCLPRDYPVLCPEHSGPVSGKESIFFGFKILFSAFG